MKTNPTPALPRNAIMRAALVKLNECRAKCPGIGGDVDAMNLRTMIGRNEWSRSTTDQAAKCLDWMGHDLGIETADEAAALRALPLFEDATAMRETLIVVLQESDSINCQVWADAHALLRRTL